MFRNVDLGDWGQAAGSESTVSTAAKECGGQSSSAGVSWGHSGWGGGGMWDTRLQRKKDWVQLISPTEFRLLRIRRFLERMNFVPVLTSRRGRISFRKYGLGTIGERRGKYES